MDQINIDPVAAAYGARDPTPSESNASLEPEDARAPHSARSFPGEYAMLQLAKHRHCLLLLLFAAAIIIAAVGLRDSREALVLARANAEALGLEKPETVAETLGALTRVDALDGGTPTATAPIAESEPESESEVALEQSEFVFESVRPTEGPAKQPTTRPTTPTPPTDPHPLNPKWYQTSHADWQMFLDMTKGLNEEGLEQGLNHDWFGSNILCGRQNRFLCSYDVYCPDGQGEAPFGGGPPRLFNADELEETQWAPYFDKEENWSHQDQHKSHWVQIGRVDEGEGGSEENSFLLCWKYDDWYAGNGVDIATVWEGEHRVWMLCCEGEQ